MRQFVRSLPVVAVAAVAAFAVASLKSQDNVPAQPETWEYATVIGYPSGFNTSDGFKTVVQSTAQICFASGDGCRYESVEANFSPRSGIPATPAEKYNQAFAKAAARLGSEGWELTSSVQGGPDPSVIQLYFRRPLTHR